ncbi:hypothetical protein TRFO_16003 [Tritrichomonas foetus]|uniref:UBX domain-containing protein n=1 Tax=Tritrichomonas foetus TaxID=1144522 RepID=A0A1J4KW79_9EUKA|nr:hypothetical protein TRFO_16003 [Tritrichomonas foetus]|eukprot:OHT13781.1 hypothetical protein TRFO_16003 [Tritrichomonas foetus]
MVQAYILFIDENKELIGSYDLKQNLTMIMYHKEREIERFDGFKFDEAVAFINEKKPNEPFSGQARTIGEIGTDFNEYLKSVRRAPQKTEPEKKPKPKAKSRFADFSPAAPSFQPQQQPFAQQQPFNQQQPFTQQQPFPSTPNPFSLGPSEGQPKPSRPSFMNPFTQEYQELCSNLEDVGYSAEEIMESILAGGAEFNECTSYIEAKRSGTQPTDRLTNPPTPGPSTLSPEQAEIYESLNDAIDALQLYYVLLVTRSSDEDTIMEALEAAQNGQPIPEPQQNPPQQPPVAPLQGQLPGQIPGQLPGQKPVDDIAMEVNRLLGADSPGQGSTPSPPPFGAPPNFSQTMPPFNPMNNPMNNPYMNPSMNTPMNPNMNPNTGNGMGMPSFGPPPTQQMQQQPKPGIYHGFDTRDDMDRYFEEQRMKEAQLIRKKQEEDRIARKHALELIQKNRQNQQREEEARRSTSSLNTTAKKPATATTTSRPSTARNESKIQFQFPDGNRAVYQFNISETVGALEAKLKEMKHVPEDALVEFDLLPSGRISCDKFGSTLAELGLTGRIAMRVILPPPPQQQEDSTVQREEEDKDGKQEEGN